MDMRDIDLAIENGTQTAQAEQAAKDSARKANEAADAQWERDTARRLRDAYNDASKVADDSGLRAGLKKLDEMSGNRIRPVEHTEEYADGSVTISTSIPAKLPAQFADRNFGFGMLPTVNIRVKADGTISATGAFTGALGAAFDSVSTKGNATEIIEFVAKYAQRASLFSPK